MGYDGNGWFSRLLCKVFGHKKPYVEKLYATICGRCGTVIQDRTNGKVSVRATHSTQAKIVELKKKSDRWKKKGF